MFLFAESGPATAVVLVALALVIGWVLFRTHRALSRHRREDSALVHTARPQRTNPGHHLDAPDEELRWEVQMHETTRELSAQLDSKMSALQALIADADRAAARLEAAGAKTPGNAQQVAQPPPTRITQAEALRPSGTSGPVQDDPGDLPGGASAPCRKEDVYTLADYGWDAAGIAGRVGIPVGEVELILRLRGKQ